jgi:hypothetical protein
VRAWPALALAATGWRCAKAPRLRDVSALLARWGGQVPLLLVEPQQACRAAARSEMPTSRLAEGAIGAPASGIVTADHWALAWEPRDASYT